MGSLRSLPKLGKIDLTKIESVFSPSPKDLWESAEKLTPQLFEELAERYGDEPEWMRVTAYREGYRGSNKLSELLLNLAGKDYWFPLSPKVYEKFIDTIVTDSRLEGLKYLQKYIRQYRDYKSNWPNKRYVKINKLDSNSFIPESEQDNVASRVGLPQAIVDAIVDMKSRGLQTTEIARTLHVSRPHVEHVLNLSGGFKAQAITDQLIQSLAQGDLDVREAVAQVTGQRAADRTNSKRTWIAMQDTKDRKRSVRVPRMAARSSRMKISPNSF